VTWLNFAAREAWFRIVFFGPSGGGKRATFAAIEAECAPERGGPLVLRRSQLLPAADGPQVIVQLDLVAAGLAAPMPPGSTPVLSLWTQSYPDNYGGNRRLAGRPDAVVFVMDSRPARQQQNLFWLGEATAHCQNVLSSVPQVFQYNHRDAPDALPIDELEAALNPKKAPFVATVATAAGGGSGVAGVLQAVSSLLATPA